MSQSYEFNKRVDQLHVDYIQHDEQGNIIYEEFEKRERNSEHWQDLEKEYGINFGDVVNINVLGRVQELDVLEDTDGLINDRVDIVFWGGSKMEDFACAEVGMSAKEWLKDIKIQPKEKKLSITEKIKNTIKTKVQTLKKGGVAARLKNKRALQNTQGLER